MPELPDIVAYLHALEARIVGQPLERLRLTSPFLLRTVRPRIEDIEGRKVRALRRIGKRIAIEFDNGMWAVLHLMIAGRLHWKAAGAKLGGRNALAAFDFPHGSLVLTEAGAKRRASLHLFLNEAEMEVVDPGGVDVFAVDLEGFRAALTAERNWQCILGRDTACGSALPYSSDTQAVVRRMGTAVHCGSGNAAIVDRAAEIGGRSRVSREGHSLSR
jgi:formamidopyrimidine-DNA glycosylase